MTATAGVLVFRCDALRSKLTIASCTANYLAANGGGKAPPSDALRKGLYPRQAGLRPCVGCALGAEHAETGKARSGLHLTVLRSDAPNSAVASSKPFDDVKPEPAPVAASREDRPPAVSMPPPPVKVRTADAPRAPSATPAGGGMPRDAVVSELLAIVAERKDAGATRSIPWSARARELAVLFHETHGANQKELEEVGLNYFTVHGWARQAKLAAGKTATEIAAEGHAAKGGVAPAVREEALERLRAGEHPSDIGVALGVSEESVRRWRNAAGIAKPRAARDDNQSVESSSVPSEATAMPPASIVPESARSEWDRPMPIDDEPDVRPAVASRDSSFTTASEAPCAPPRAVRITEDDVIDFCERAGLGYRMTQAVLGIVMGNATFAWRILGREIDRKGAA